MATVPTFVSLPILDAGSYIKNTWANGWSPWFSSQRSFGFHTRGVGREVKLAWEIAKVMPPLSVLEELQTMDAWIQCFTFPTPKATDLMAETHTKTKEDIQIIGEVSGSLWQSGTKSTLRL